MIVKLGARQRTLRHIRLTSCPCDLSLSLSLPLCVCDLTAGELAFLRNHPAPKPSGLANLFTWAEEQGAYAFRLGDEEAAYL